MTAARHEPERLPDTPTAPPVVVRDAALGGQAVLEGVMMRGVSTWAVAVRAPAPEQIADGRHMESGEAALGEIRVQSFPLVSALRRHRWMRLPVLRGVIALGESLKLGVHALNIAVNIQAAEDEKELSRAAWFAMVATGLGLAVGLFFLLPVFITSLFKDALPGAVTFVVVEKLIRISIFLTYIWAVTRLSHLQRVFQYHGAEHKAISCFEAGVALTPENAQRFSRLHPRCGTSFMLIVMIVAVVVFAPFGTPEWYWLFASRVLGIPLVAGLAFEVIKWFGRNRTKRWAQILMVPGLKLQLLTTREPELAQLAVAIAALQAVLDVETPGEASDDDLVGMEVVA
jgi:uncharacterized protein YqhQ